jgi:hypothetical protein
MAKSLKKLNAAVARINGKKPYFNISEIKYIVYSYLPGASKKQVEIISKNVVNHMEIVLFSEIRQAVVSEIKNMAERKDLIV